MPGFHLLSGLLVVAALASYLNHRFLRLPSAIGMMAISLAGAIALAALDHAGAVDLHPLSDLLHVINFSDLLLHGMLAFLLFAGALHVNAAELREHAAPILTLATAGVLITSAVAGTLLWGIARLVGIELPYVYALLFGTLIAPTDPIAVLAIIRKAQAPRSIEIRITGESLFNDGIGVVLFLTVLQFATGEATGGAMHVALLLLKEVAGGIAVGGALGWIAYRLLLTVDEYPVEVLLTAALAAGAYSAAEILHVSAPIAAVLAGLVIGNHGRRYAMSEKTRANVDTFWELIDELLSAVLFALIGLEVLVIDVSGEGWPLAVLAAGAIPAVLLGRVAGVLLPTPLLGVHAFASRIAVFTWAGLRGGISIALALSLGDSPYRETLLLVTYVVVVFSVLVQGLTLKPLLVKLCPRLTAAEKRI